VTDETETEIDDQKTRLSTKEHGDYDTTQLRSASYGFRVHRDYLAHVLRWGWAGRFIGQTAGKARRVLEPGCGQDLPLFKVMSVMQSYLPDKYVGVDLNSIPFVAKRKPGTYKWADVRDKFNFVEQWPELHGEYGSVFDLAVSFEVIEHMKVEAGDQYLHGIHELLQPGGRLLLSTPVFNGAKARNHIHEYEVAELYEKITAAGFMVARRYGTFANYRDIKAAVADSSDAGVKAAWETYERLLEFYDHSLLACFLAPLFPDASRNNAWVCFKPTGDPETDRKMQVDEAFIAPAEHAEVLAEQIDAERKPASGGE